MKTWALLAPGPSASAGLAERVLAAGIPLGAIGNAFQLAKKPKFIAATDKAWWAKYPEARNACVRRFAMHEVDGVELVKIPPIGICNSGVLGLECAKNLGARRILLLGFDMHGSHFFGQYTNGLKNTASHQRRNHLKQYEQWGQANRGVEVVNCTPGSALKCFPFAELECALGST